MCVCANCVCIYIYIFIYTFMHVYMCIFPDICTYLFLYIYTHIHIHIYMYGYVCVCVSRCMHIQHMYTPCAVVRDVRARGGCLTASHFKVYKWRLPYFIFISTTAGSILTWLVRLGKQNTMHVGLPIGNCGLSCSNLLAALLRVSNWLKSNSRPSWSFLLWCPMPTRHVVLPTEEDI